MGTYAGEIKISGKNGFFVNFYPGYQLIGNNFEYLSRQDIMNLLPGSQPVPAAYRKSRTDEY